MTHDELLAKMSKPAHNLNANDARNVYLLALRAVVEMHKPIDNPNFPDSDIWCWQCADGRGYAKYPCPTIQIIKKELT